VAKNTEREIVNHLDEEFAGLIKGLNDLVRSVPQDLLYRTPPKISIGENVLRSAAAVEQTCGGLTANLWDDPFEWTLPETLSTANLIVEYLSEVDEARQRAFNSILDDSALTRYISVPSREPQQLVSLLLETLVKASDYRGRAVATIKMLSGEGTAGFII
jgi:hypothetical protein